MTTNGNFLETKETQETKSYKFQENEMQTKLNVKTLNVQLQKILECIALEKTEFHSYVKYFIYIYLLYLLTSIFMSKADKYSVVPFF